MKQWLRAKPQCPPFLSGGINTHLAGVIMWFCAFSMSPRRGALESTVGRCLLKEGTHEQTDE